MVIVDSSVWIEAARRDGELAYKVGLESLLEEYEAAWCGPVKLEVLGGARPAERKSLEFFFECIPYVPMNDRLWDLAKEFSWKLRDRGLAVPWNDILIAALSVEKIYRVYAKDKHFEQMSQVIGVRLYSPGYGGSYSPDSGG